MSGWLPPGCTDKDIDDAVSGDESAQCDCCGEMFHVEQLQLIPAGKLGNSAGCDTYACPKCRGWEEEPEPNTYLANENGLIIAFGADSEDDAMEICKLKHWKYEGRKDDDGND